MLTYSVMQVDRSEVSLPGHLVHLPGFQIEPKLPRPELDTDPVKIKIHLPLKVTNAGEQ